MPTGRLRWCDNVQRVRDVVFIVVHASRDPEVGYSSTGGKCERNDRIISCRLFAVSIVSLKLNLNLFWLTVPISFTLMFFY